jgi:flagellar biosynthesis chaperone FliJ
VTKLQGRLSSVADAKEKALDQNTVLGRLNSEADAVSQQLSTCVDEMNSFLSELATDLDNGVYDPNLDATASQAHVDCASAQTDNDELQITLGGVG